MNKKLLSHLEVKFNEAKISAQSMEYQIRGASASIIDKFFDNWTINFSNGHDMYYFIKGGNKVAPYEMHRLVLEAVNEGYMKETDIGFSKRYSFTDEGKEFLRFKFLL